MSLPGSDRADWRTRVLNEVAGAPRLRNKRGPQVGRFSIEVPPGALIGLLREACAKRGVSPTGYIRRAMLAFIAHDLGIPFSAIVKLDPRFSPPNTASPIADPEGKLGGPWEIS